MLITAILPSSDGLSELVLLKAELKSLAQNPNQAMGQGPSGHRSGLPGDRKPDGGDKKDKKFEPAAPPARVGRKQRKQKGPEAAARLPTVTPLTKCKLRLLKLERIKDYLLMEEEFVANQERLKPQEEKAEEDRSKVDDLRGSPMSVGNLEELIDENHAIVSSSVGPEYYVGILSFVDKDQLEPGCAILMHNKVLSVVGLLQDEVDPMVSVMKVEKAPLESYADIGGLDAQIQEIKEAVELPLTHPELYEDIGIKPPKGVILYGEPGTGKTLLAKAVANSTSATFLRVVGSELIQKYLGDGPKLVRELFRVADDLSPSIVFIDEIDAVGTKRYDAHSVPSSHNSLSKLFSMYNGCIWKGGRLRLEKAKENYLDRLKREWAEDAQLVSSEYTNVNVDVVKERDSLKKPNETHSSKMKQLRMFFPRLQKVKSLPFSGTGKHKYSFRRVEVPSLPTHFCDCEEHSGPLHYAEGKQIPVQDEQGGGMTKEELDVMNSVMNKLFEMENMSSTPHCENELTKEEDYSIQVPNEPLLDESDGYSTADEDNLIINVVSRGQELKLNKRKASKDGPTDMLKQQTRNYEEIIRNEYESIIPRGMGNLQDDINGSRILPGAQLIEPQSGDMQSASGLSWSQKSPWKEFIGDRGNSAFNLSDIFPGISSDKKEKSKSDGGPNSNNSKNKKLLRHENQGVQLDKTEVEGFVEAQPSKLDSSSSKTGRGSAWLHKTSWTQLVNSNNSSSFSITQILPGVTFDKQEPAEPHGLVTTDARDSKNNDTIEKDKSESVLDGSMDLQIIREGDGQRIREPRQLVDLGSNIPSALTENKHNSATKPMRRGDIVIGEVCSFMRNDASLKEWANAKAALSGSGNMTSKGKKRPTFH